MFLLHGAVSAGAPALPDPAGLPEGPGAAVAPRGAEPHAQDGAGVRQARRAGPAAAGRPGTEGHADQKLGACASGRELGQVVPSDVGVCVSALFCCSAHGCVRVSVQEGHTDS